MSKHKHFHNIKTPVQALQHGRKNGIGPVAPRFVPRLRPSAGDKKAAPSAANTEGGKQTPQRN